jgi:hypothetical protein
VLKHAAVEGNLVYVFKNQIEILKYNITLYNMQIFRPYVAPLWMAAIDNIEIKGFSQRYRSFFKHISMYRNKRVINDNREIELEVRERERERERERAREREREKESKKAKEPI